MSEVRYGPVIKDYHARTFRVADAQKFHPNGAAFVYLDANGYVTLALTADVIIFGWAMIPRSLGRDDLAAGYWTSKTAASTGISYVPVIVARENPGVTYRVPCAAGLAVLARCGELHDLISVNDGTKQYADLAAHATNVLAVVGLPNDGDTNSILVTINLLQGDT
jgi:hypothetical protein